MAAAPAGEVDFAERRCFVADGDRLVWPDTKLFDQIVIQRNALAEQLELQTAALQWHRQFIKRN